MQGVAYSLHRIRYRILLLRACICPALGKSQRSLPRMRCSSNRSICFGEVALWVFVSVEVAAEDLESARLQAALWRHLDPNKVPLPLNYALEMCVKIIV